MSRVVLFGPSAPGGSATMRLLARDPRFTPLLVVGRHASETVGGQVEHVTADPLEHDVADLLAGAGAVVHFRAADRGLAGDPVARSARIVAAAARAGVRAYVSIGSTSVYAPSLGRVDESAPLADAAPHARHELETERLLAQPELTGGLRVVSLRAPLVVDRARLPNGLVPVVALLRALAADDAVPHVDGVRFQLISADDLAQACRRALVTTVKGPVNIAAHPPLDGELVAEILDLPVARVSAEAARAALEALPDAERIEAAFALEHALSTPLVSTARAVRDLGWTPTGALGPLRLLLRQASLEAAWPRSPMFVAAASAG